MGAPPWLSEGGRRLDRRPSARAGVLETCNRCTSAGSSGVKKGRFGLRGGEGNGARKPLRLNAFEGFCRSGRFPLP